MNIICDLDGTLVDTREAVGAAYFHAEVNMPEAAWGRPWKQWLPQMLGSMEAAERAHHKKNLAYEGCLSVYGKPTALGRLLSQRDFPYALTILTGASSIAASAALRLLGIELKDLAAYNFEMTIDQKIEHVMNRAQHEHQGIYYDDDLLTCNRMRVGFKDIGVYRNWQVCHVG